MFSVREAALREIKSRLESSGPAAAVYRSRLDQLDIKKLNIRRCFEFSPGEQVNDNTYGDHQSVGYRLPVHVRYIVDSTGFDDSELDPGYVFAVQALIGADSNLGGIVNEIREVGAPVVFRPEGLDIIGMEMQFDVMFATKRGDPTQLA